MGGEEGEELKTGEQRWDREAGLKGLPPGGSFLVELEDEHHRSSPGFMRRRRTVYISFLSGKSPDTAC